MFCWETNNIIYVINIFAYKYYIEMPVSYRKYVGLGA